MTTSDSGVVAPATVVAMRFRAFPVAVVIDGALYEPALIWATDETTQVYVAGPDSRSPVLVASLAATSARRRSKGEFLDPGNRKVRFVADLADGTELAVGLAPGCGCGHPLKSWSPPKVEVGA